MQNIGERLQILLDTIPISGVQLARDMGHSASYIYDITAGRKKIQKQLLDYLEVRFNVNTEWLYDDACESMFKSGGKMDRYQHSQLLLDIIDLPVNDQEIVRAVVGALRMLGKTEAKRREKSNGNDGRQVEEGP